MSKLKYVMVALERKEINTQGDNLYKLILSKKLWNDLKIADSNIVKIDFNFDQYRGYFWYQENNEWDMLLDDSESLFYTDEYGEEALIEEQFINVQNYGDWVHLIFNGGIGTAIHYQVAWNKVDPEEIRVCDSFEEAERYVYDD